MPPDKIIFIREKLVDLIAGLSEQEKPLWGKMNAHQMIEHLTDFFNVSIEKIVFPLVTPQEQLVKYRQFLYSDIAFRENTKAPTAILGDLPLPVKSATFIEAQKKLQETVEDFFGYFSLRPGKTTMHPVFGLLNFDEWIMLHYKHVQHHLRQFGVIG